MVGELLGDALLPTAQPAVDPLVANAREERAQHRPLARATHGAPGNAPQLVVVGGAQPLEVAGDHLADVTLADDQLRDVPAPGMLGGGLPGRCGVANDHIWTTG